MEYELYHYGRKGMRWYQNIFTKGKEAAATRKKRKAEKEKEAEEKRKINVEEQKKQIRNSRSAEQVYKNAHLFNDKELTEIYNRLNTENNIKNLIPKKVNKGKQFAENASSTLKTVGEATKNFNNMITQFRNIGKLFGGKKTNTSSGNANAQKGDTGKTKTKTEKTKSEVFEGIVEGIGKSGKSSSSESKSRTSTIIDAEWWSDSDNATSVARALTKNVGSRTVNLVTSNPDRIESGRSFVSGMLALPAPKDRD